MMVQDASRYCSLSSLQIYIFLDYKIATNHSSFRCTGLMDMETDTNPIDRSVAHLLFHRPSDPSMLLPNETLPFKSGALIHGSVINPPVKTEKQVCQEDSSTGVEKKFLGGNT
uniref:Uncharacterized protein n=1 Tax=Cajanus cajan TaxID=3821 RepID=A0A151T0H5_CAJCA|nr:hypothetical protein KK1_022960 [Cajanus cajan]